MMFWEKNAPSIMPKKYVAEMTPIIIVDICMLLSCTVVNVVKNPFPKVKMHILKIGAINGINDVNIVKTLFLLDYPVFFRRFFILAVKNFYTKFVINRLFVVIHYLISLVFMLKSI